MQTQNLTQLARHKAQSFAAYIDTEAIATIARMQMPVDI